MKTSIVSVFIITMIGFAFPAFADVSSTDAGVAAAPVLFDEIPDMCLADCTQAYQTANDACLKQFNNCVTEEQVRVDPPKVTPEKSKKPKAPEAPKASKQKVENFREALKELEKRTEDGFTSNDEKLKKVKETIKLLDDRVGKVEDRVGKVEEVIKNLVGRADKVGVMGIIGFEACLGSTRQVDLTDLRQIDQNGNNVGNDGTLKLQDPGAACVRPVLGFGLQNKYMVLKISGSPFGVTFGSAQASNGDPSQVIGYAPSVAGEFLGFVTPDLALGVYGQYMFNKVGALPSGKASLDAQTFTGGLAADWTFLRFGSTALALSARVGGGYGHLSTRLPTGKDKWWPALALDGQAGVTMRFNPFQAAE